jgi:hypothetical protein
MARHVDPCGKTPGRSQLTAVCMEAAMAVTDAETIGRVRITRDKPFTWAGLSG